MKNFNLSKLLVLLLIILVSGCKKDTDPSTIQFSTQKNVPVIYVKVNNKPAIFILDTGASVSIIDKNFKTHYGFGTMENLNEGTITGVGGTVRMEDVYNCEVKYGDSILNVDLKSISLSHLAKVSNIVGVIGSDYFVKNKVSIDYNSKTLSSFN